MFWYVVDEGVHKKFRYCLQTLDNLKISIGVKYSHILEKISGDEVTNDMVEDDGDFCWLFDGDVGNKVPIDFVGRMIAGFVIVRLIFN